MQYMSDELKDSIRATYQVPVAKIELYNGDGSLAEIIEDVQKATLSVASSRKILRTLTLTLDNSDERFTIDPLLFEKNVLWYTKTVKIFFGYKIGPFLDGEELLPQGVFTIEGIKANNDPDDRTIDVECQDLKGKLVEDKFEDTFKILGTAAESKNYATASSSTTATASSSASGYPADNAKDGDVHGSSWRPDPSDGRPTIEFYLYGHFDLNVIYLYWGEQSFDYFNRVHYYIEHSLDRINWTRIQDLNGLDEHSSLFGDVEHCFDQIHARYIRITVMNWSGQVSLRMIKPQMITATQTIDKVIKDVAFSAGIRDFQIPLTRRYIREAMADIGDEKIHFITKMASSIGWKSPEFNEEGFLTTGPRNINPVDVSWDFHVDTDNIFYFSPKFSNYNIYNVIVVVYKSSSEKAIVGKAVDNDPDSPTYVNKPGMGRRVKKYESESLDSQDKVDLFAQQKLYDRTRFHHHTTLPLTGHPGIQVDDVIKLTVPVSKISNELYVVTGWETDFNASNGEFSTRLNISQLGTFNDEEAGQVGE